VKNVDNALQDALSPLFPGAVFPNLYIGQLTEYVVTSYTTLPQVPGENGPGAARHLVMVRYFLPTGVNPNVKKMNICTALLGEGFTMPSITPAHEKEGQCWIFECEYANAGAVYGYS
jgi:hypothetical protein